MYDLGLGIAPCKRKPNLHELTGLIVPHINLELDNTRLMNSP